MIGKKIEFHPTSKELPHLANKTQLLKGEVLDVVLCPIFKTDDHDALIEVYRVSQYLVEVFPKEVTCDPQPREVVCIYPYQIKRIL